MAKPSGWKLSPDDDIERDDDTGNLSAVLKLPPAVATVSPDAIRSYVHSKRVENYLVGDTLGEGSFAKVKEAFHVLVGEKVRLQLWR